FAAVLIVPIHAVKSQPAPYDINVIMPLTGPGSFIGQTSQKTLRIAESVVNKQGGIKGRPVRFVFYDDQTNPQLSVQLANGIIAKKPPFLMGSMLSALCRAMLPLFSSGPELYCLTPAIYPTSGWVLSSNISTRDLIFGTVRYMRERGWKRLARLTTTDASGQDSDRDIAEALKLPENKDVTIVADEHFNPPDVSVAAQVARIKASGAQGMIIWAPGTPFGTALRAVHDAGLDDMPISTTSANMVYAQMKQYSSFMPKNVYFQACGYSAGESRSAAGLRKVKVFEDAMKANGVTVPTDFQSGISWDPAMIMVDALRALGTDATAEQFKNYLNNLHDYAGISGIYDFRKDPHGITIDDMIMMRWDNTKQVWVKASKFGGYPL
ncbi:MAG TPA: ABC transporter substrate-binding protein, partial [Candidatus Acidoferrales bacterium]|nr:ABC transporter substrate-binding protein [Candidatus Acidoferrales bacterium]